MRACWGWVGLGRHNPHACHQACRPCASRCLTHCMPAHRDITAGATSAEEHRLPYARLGWRARTHTRMQAHVPPQRQVRLLALSALCAARSLLTDATVLRVGGWPARQLPSWHA